MFCDKENVNILTALLRDHGVKSVVVCPGSRNAPIVHNLNELPDLHCYPVTDERSAGFMAVGLSLASAASGRPEPVAVCVTSGSALLNLYPAVAEAYYQHVPLIVISADRPEAWIGQQDGQTLPQAGVFDKMIRKSVNLPEVLPGEKRDEQAWHCERLINEALLECCRRGSGPVHINVPISEPLYGFHTARLPQTTCWKYRKQADCGELCAADFEDFTRAQRPMIVIGQEVQPWTVDELAAFRRRAVVLAEPLGADAGVSYFEEVLACVGDDEHYQPDFILYTGGHLVSKMLKQYLRKAARRAKVWRVSEEGDCVDTFMHLDAVCQWQRRDVIRMAGLMPECADEVAAFCQRWQRAQKVMAQQCAGDTPAFSSMYAVKSLEEAIGALPSENRQTFRVMYGNSMAVRLGCLYAHHPVCCNRGVNGIEGSLSTAAGLSVGMAAGSRVVCVLGDLSFFYDQNALWNRNLNGALRILLLNNGGGAIFGKFDGLRESKAREKLVMAEHPTTAQHVCETHDVEYMCATDAEQLGQGIARLLHAETERPVLLEVQTDIETDSEVYGQYFERIKNTTII